MNCPECSVNDDRVIDSRHNETYIRRRRECLRCSHRWTTTEVAGQAPSVIAQVLNMTEEELQDALRARRIFTAAACEYYGVEDEDTGAAEMDQQSVAGGVS